MLMLYLTSTSISSLTLPDCLSHKEEIQRYLLYEKEIHRYPIEERGDTCFSVTRRGDTQIPDCQSQKEEIHRYPTQQRGDTEIPDTRPQIPDTRIPDPQIQHEVTFSYHAASCDQLHVRCRQSEIVCTNFWHQLNAKEGKECR